jgi:hypothetical protein
LCTTPYERFQFIKSAKKSANFFFRYFKAKAENPNITKMQNQQFFFSDISRQKRKIQKSQKCKISNYFFSDISRQKRKIQKSQKCKISNYFISDISRQKRKISHLRIRMI